MPPKTYSHHKVTSHGNLGFDPVAYSRFKFGDDGPAKEFGFGLADGFIAKVLLQLDNNRQMVVVPSPFSFIPTATFAMKVHFVSRLNRWLAAHGYPVLQEAKVHRTVTYKEDYGQLDAEQRMQLISNDSFYIDKTFVEGKVLLFLDDIRITGSHEKMILKMVDQFALENEIHLIYFAELTNPQIHPNIENWLNYYAVKSVFDLEDIVDGGNFLFNTRMVKYVLNCDHDAFCIFIQNRRPEFLCQIYDLALGNGYHTMENYALNLTYIRQKLTTENKKAIKYGH